MRTPGLAILRLILHSPKPSGEADHSPSAPPASALRRWSRGWPGAGLALLLLCLAVYLPGLWSIPPIDRDESRFAQASRQMYESGDYIVPRIQDRPRLNKPPLSYWLQCASIAVFGDAPGQYAHGNIWVFRIPGVLCAIAGILLTWRFGLRLMDPRAAALAAALLAVCPLMAWDAHQARADQLLLLTVIASQFALWSCWRATRNSPTTPAPLLPCLALWTSIALGILAKGPVTPMISLLTALALSWQTGHWRWLRALRPLTGIVILTALIAPWAIAVASRVGWSTYLHTIINETLGRSTGAKEGHWGPPGYHLVALCVLFWPGVLMTGLALRRAWSRRNSAPCLFLLAWILPSWIVFELVLTKLPHYTMPLYPAIALLSGRAVFAAASGRLAGLREWGTRIGFAIWGLVAVGILAAGIALLALLSSFDDVNDEAMITSLWYLLIGFTLIQTARSLVAGRWLQAQLRSLIAAVLMLVLLFQTLAPAVNRMSTRIVKLIEGVDASGAHPIGDVAYQEDSLIFLTRGRVQRLSMDQWESWMQSKQQPMVLLRPNARNDWPEAIRELVVTEVTGLNYSRGRVQTVELWWNEQDQ